MQIDGITIDPDKYIYVACHDYGNGRNWTPVCKNEKLNTNYKVTVKRGRISKIILSSSEKEPLGTIYNFGVTLSRGDTIVIYCNAVTWAAAVTKQVIFSHSFVTARNAVNKYINQQNEVHQK